MLYNVVLVSAAHHSKSVTYIHSFSSFSSRSCSSWALEHRLIVLAHGLSCFVACGIFPDQESNLSPVLGGRFFTTCHLGSPFNTYKNINIKICNKTSIFFFLVRFLFSTRKCLYFFKFNFIFKLYIIVLVLPNIKMNPPQVYMCSPS